MIDTFALLPYAIPLFLVVISLESRALTFNGAVSALLMSYVILITQNIYWFAIILALFFIGTAATRYKEERKEKMKLLQKIRGSWNVMANGGMAMLMALLGGPQGLYGFVGAVSTATSDTVASEIGVLSKNPPRLVTTFRKVKTGSEGAVSSLGTIFAFIGALIIGFLSLYITGSQKIILVSVIAGVGGQFADSYLGALVENKIPGFGNSMTNFIATAFGAVFGMVLGAFI